MFKAEFFDTQFGFVDRHPVPDSLELQVDYLTMEATTITVPGTSKVEKGNYVHIDGNYNFDGIVSDVKPKDKTTDISVRPLQAIFDVEIFTKEFSDVADFIYSEGIATLVENSDILQNIPLVLTNMAHAAERPVSVTETKVNILNLMYTALTTYRIAVDCKLDMKQKYIVANIQQVTDEKTIEAGLPNVISKEFTIGDNYGNFNKALIKKIVKDEETGTVILSDAVPFFLHTDGTVSDADTDRIVPVYQTVEMLDDCEDWNVQALGRATELLAGAKYNNEIVLKYRYSDRIVHPANMKIGTDVTVYFNSTKYKSILSGYVVSKETISLIFGTVREELTKKIILDRRKKL